MINVYTDFETDYESNGAAVLMPTVCTVSEEAGGSYELNLIHPTDPRGVWKLLNTGYIIKCPVPVRTTLPVVTGDELDIYRITADTALRAAPSEPRRVSYAPWYYHNLNIQNYLPGDKVTDTADGHNYQCIKEPVGDPNRYWRPSHPLAGQYWQRIADEVGGAQVLLTLKAGADVYELEKVNGSWWRVATLTGAEGFIRADRLEFLRTVRPDFTDLRILRDQLFRIYDVQVDSDKQSVRVRARHVSYDYNANLINPLVITQQPAGTALALIKNGMLEQRDNIFATNLTAADGLFTGDVSWNNVVNALLDPDKGFVPYYKAQIIRDNWDIYIYRNENTDRGVRFEYGNNLAGVSWTRSSAKLINRVIPVAKDAAGGDFFLEETTVDSPFIGIYPVIRMERLRVDGQVGKDDGNGGTYTEESLREFMRAKAMERFTVDHADTPSTEIKVSFVLLGDTVEYTRYKGMQKVYLYDTVTVYEPVLGIDIALQVKGYTWDAIQNRYTDLTLGDVFDYTTRAIAGYELRNGTIQIDKLSPAAVAELKGV